MSSLYPAVLSPPSLPLHRPPPAADPVVTTSTASSASGLPTAPPSAVPSARPSPRPPVSPPSPGPHSQPQSQGHAHLHPPTSDEIDAVIQMATSARPSPDGRPVPLKDTRTQLFVGNVSPLSPPLFYFFYSFASCASWISCAWVWGSNFGLASVFYTRRNLLRCRWRSPSASNSLIHAPPLHRCRVAGVLVGDTPSFVLDASEN